MREIWEITFYAPIFAVLLSFYFIIIFYFFSYVALRLRFEMQQLVATEEQFGAPNIW